MYETRVVIYQALQVRLQALIGDFQRKFTSK